MEDLRRTIQERLRELKAESGLTIDQLGKAVGISRNCWNEWFRSPREGRASVPSLRNLVRIANHFDVSLDWLCGRSSRRREKTLLDMTIDVDEERWELERRQGLKGGVPSLIGPVHEDPLPWAGLIHPPGSLNGS